MNKLTLAFDWNLLKLFIEIVHEIYYIVKRNNLFPHNPIKTYPLISIIPPPKN